jgi:hypothetical protein
VEDASDRSCPKAEGDGGLLRAQPASNSAITTVLTIFIIAVYTLNHLLATFDAGQGKMFPETLHFFREPRAPVPPPFFDSR